jgi:FkbM family methyltransferase
MTSGIPNSPMSAGTLLKAIQELGKSAEAREAIVAVLRSYESQSPHGTGFDVREEVSGPILDGLFGYGSTVTKRLASGVTISAAYTSKIIRDFVMSDPEPDHVWEPQTTRTLLELTRNASTVLIGGAYIGDHAVLIADQLRGRGTVHCFELSEQNSGFLRANLQQNSLTNVEVIQTALWSASNVRLKLVGDDSHASPQVAAEGDHDTFPATTIEQYAAEKGIDHFDLIMLDIEGGEFAALNGAYRFLDAPAEEAPIVIFEIHASYSDWSAGFERAEINQFLLKKGFTLFAIRDHHRNVAMNNAPVELIDVDDVFVGGPAHGFNMLATKQPEKLDPRIFKRVRGVSPKLLFHRDPALHAPLHVT